jgi:hypothetical protein
VEAEEEAAAGGRLQGVGEDAAAQLGVEAEDGPGQDPFPPARRRGHGGGNHAVADHHLGIALEGPVGHRGHAVEVGDLDAAGGVAAHPGDQHRGEVAGGGLLDLGPAPGRELGKHDVEQPAAALGHLEGGGQEVEGLEDADAGELHQAPEEAVLLAHALPEEDVVEEQLLHHGGDHLVHLGAGLVDQDRAQAADLGRHVQHRSSRAIP